MSIADDKAATSALLDAHHRAGHIEPVDDEYGQPAYRVTAAGLAWARRIMAGDLAAAYDAHTAGPRTWNLPPEPGPEVTAVRDKDGRVWQREAPGWRCDDAYAHPLDTCTWPALIRLAGPLTDASGESS